MLDPSNNQTKSIWGSHLNKSSAETSKVGTFRRHKTESAISRGPSFSGLFSEASMSQPSQQTRFSLKKSGKTVARKSSAKSFFDTLGGDLEMSTLPSPPTEESSTKKFVDPLARFDPEISMGGCLDVDDNSDEIVFSTKFDPKPVGDKPDDPVKKHANQVKKPVKHVDTGKRHALSVLSVLSSSQKPESRLSFSGIFPKATTPVKASFNDNDETSVDNDTSNEKTTKRKRIVSESQNQNSSSSNENSPILNASESKRSRTDLTVEKTSLNDPSEKAIPKNDIYAIGFEEADDDPRGFASAKTVRSFVAGKKASQNKNTENYVKIDLKRKNYVRGKKTMTGAKYRRQEWKRKEAEKTKKGANKKKSKVRFVLIMNLMIRDTDMLFIYHFLALFSIVPLLLPFSQYLFCISNLVKGLISTK